MNELFPSTVEGKYFNAEIALLKCACVENIENTLLETERK